MIVKAVREFVSEATEYNSIARERKVSVRILDQVER